MLGNGREKKIIIRCGRPNVVMHCLEKVKLLRRRKSNFETFAVRTFKVSRYCIKIRRNAYKRTTAIYENSKIVVAVFLVNSFES